MKWVTVRSHWIRVDLKSNATSLQEEEKGFPGVQWLRISLPTQRTQVQSLLQEDPTCLQATKPVPTATEPLRRNYWGPRAWSHPGHPSGRPTHCNEAWPPRAASRESPRAAVKTSTAKTQNKYILKKKKKKRKGHRDPERKPTISSRDGAGREHTLPISASSSRSSPDMLCWGVGRPGGTVRTPPPEDPGMESFRQPWGRSTWYRWTFNARAPSVRSKGAPFTWPACSSISLLDKEKAATSDSPGPQVSLVFGDQPAQRSPSPLAHGKLAPRGTTWGPGSWTLG